MSDRFGDTQLGAGLGCGIVILAVGLAIGGCIRLASGQPAEVSGGTPNTATATAALPIRPDPALTPGMALTNVTVEQVCKPGYAKSVRDVPASVKRQVYLRYGFTKQPATGQFEVDHLISLELGGANSISNLWPQSYTTTPWNAHVKDKLEDRMHELLVQDLAANGHDHATALMQQFQQEISTDWIGAYQKYLSAETGVRSAESTNKEGK